MDNRAAKAYAKLALEDILIEEQLGKMYSKSWTDALEANMDYYMDMYTEEEAVRKAERL